MTPSPKPYQTTCCLLSTAPLSSFPPCLSSPDRFALSEPERQSFSKVFERSYDAGATALQEEYTAMIAQERENALLLNTRGELSAEVSAEYERRRKVGEKDHRISGS